MWTVIFSIITIITILVFQNYRRQVKDTCRYLEFLQKHQTNFRIPSGLPFQELYDLSHNINKLLEQEKEMEKKVKQNEKERKYTITSISHDIRTPLTSLDGFFQLLKNAENQQERVQYEEVIQNRIDRLKYLLEELFTYTKLQNESYHIPTYELDIQQCICVAVLSFYQEFQEKGIQVHTDFPKEKIMGKGNEEAIYRIVQNILKNVLEHGSTFVEFVLKQEEKGVYFSCANLVDDPQNIDIHKVFTQFYKADSSRTKDTTGLGLAIAKELIQRIDGKITAELREKYFVITLYFPLSC